MLPSQALLMLCHLNNDLVTLIIHIYGTDCSVTHDLHLILPGGIFSLTVPGSGPGPYPVIILGALFKVLILGYCILKGTHYTAAHTPIKWSQKWRWCGKSDGGVGG